MYEQNFVLCTGLSGGSRVTAGADAYQVANQAPLLAGFNLLSSDPVLAAVIEGVPQTVLDGLADFGRQWGAADTMELARIANQQVPTLRQYGRVGDRIDQVEFHLAWHALMRRSIGAGLHSSVWDAAQDEGQVRSLARSARLFMTAQVEVGHIFPLSTTNASVAALAHAPDLARRWLPQIRSRKYDSSIRPMSDKAGITLGLGVTERQAGTDLGGLITRAENTSDGTWRISGHKWFLSAPMCDAFIVLAVVRAGLTCFMVPRLLSDGTRNGIEILRLKDKLGARSNATAEVSFTRSVGYLIGEVGRGPAAMADMMALLRLDNAVASAGQMRIAMAEAVHYARHRRVGEEPLIDSPLMNRVLADMALDAVAATALTFRLAESYDRAENDPAEAAFGRLMTPAVRYWVGKMAPPFIAEAMEVLGSSGYVEDYRLARHYRDAPVNMLFEGAGNTMCLEVMSVMRRSSQPLEAVLAAIEDALGSSGKSTLNVLRAAAAVALADEGSARILTEQLAMTVAAAALRRRFPAVIADAFLETRLGKPWRTTYGMLDSRFDASAFIDYICPAV